MKNCIHWIGSSNFSDFDFFQVWDRDVTVWSEPVVVKQKYGIPIILPNGEKVWASHICILTMWVVFIYGYTHSKTDAAADDGGSILAQDGPVETGGGWLCKPQSWRLLYCLLWCAHPGIQKGWKVGWLLSWHKLCFMADQSTMPLSTWGLSTYD